jgi:hypothetical protein
MDIIPKVVSRLIADYPGTLPMRVLPIAHPQITQITEIKTAGVDSCVGSFKKYSLSVLVAVSIFKSA